jgi:hypothetical protein
MTPNLFEVTRLRQDAEVEAVAGERLDERGSCAMLNSGESQVLASTGRP